MIYLIRHGETVGNASRFVQTPDSPLSERGRSQAERLGKRLAADRVEHIISSNLTRAVSTAESVQRATGASMSIDPALQERNFGDLRGRSYSELTIDIFAADYLPPNGETWAVFHARVDRAWENVQKQLERVSGNVAIVTHGLVCYSLASRYLTLRSGEAVPPRWGNASLTIIERQRPWQVQLLDCVAHLSDDGADSSTKLP